MHKLCLLGTRNIHETSRIGNHVLANSAPSARSRWAGWRRVGGRSWGGGWWRHGGLPRTNRLIAGTCDQSIRGRSGGRGASGRAKKEAGRRRGGNHRKQIVEAFVEEGPSRQCRLELAGASVRLLIIVMLGEERRWIRIWARAVVWTGCHEIRRARRYGKRPARSHLSCNVARRQAGRRQAKRDDADDDDDEGKALDDCRPDLITVCCVIIRTRLSVCGVMCCLSPGPAQRVSHACSCAGSWGVGAYASTLFFADFERCSFWLRVSGRRSLGRLVCSLSGHTGGAEARRRPQRFKKGW